MIVHFRKDNEDVLPNIESLIEPICAQYTNASKLITFCASVYAKSYDINTLKYLLNTANTLLQDDGLIVVYSELEYDELLSDLCDQIFGAINLIKKTIVDDNTYVVLCYAKNFELLRESYEPLPADFKIKRRVFHDETGSWHIAKLWHRGLVPDKRFIIKGPHGRQYLPPTSCSWIYDAKKMQGLLANNLIFFPREKAAFPYLKKYVMDNTGEQSSSKIILNLDHAKCTYLDTLHNIDNDPRGPWRRGTLMTKQPANHKLDVYPIISPTGKECWPSKNRCWQYSKELIEELLQDNRIYFSKHGNGEPYEKIFANDRVSNTTVVSVWHKGRMLTGCVKILYNIDNDPRGVWQKGDLMVTASSGGHNIYPIISPFGKELLPHKGRHWRYTQDEVRLLFEDNRIYFAQNGHGLPYEKVFLNTEYATMSLLANNPKSNPKKILDDTLLPVKQTTENVIRAIIRIFTNSSNFILDLCDEKRNISECIRKQYITDKHQRKYLMIKISGNFVGIDSINNIELEEI